MKKESRFYNTARKNSQTNIYPFIKHLKGKSSLTLLFLSFLVFFVASCKDESGEAGLVVDSTINPDAIVKSDFNISTYTVKADSISTDSLSGNLLGAVVDPIFGNYRSTIFTQIRLLENQFVFPAGASLDSIVLSLQFNEEEEEYFYGDNNPIEVNVYRLTEELTLEKNYYHTDETQAEINPMGTFNSAFNFEDSITLIENGVTLVQGPQLRIPLNAAFGNEILNASNTVFADNEAFQDFLHGVKIEAEYAGSGGVLANISLGGSSSRLVVYYDDTSSREFPISFEDVAYCKYEQPNTPPAIQTQLDNPGVHYNTTYVQSMGSVKTKIEISDLLDFAKNEDVIIHEALIQLRVQDNSANGEYHEPQKLNLFIPDAETGKNAPIQDYVDLIFGFPYARYGGDFQIDKNIYQFFFTHQLQKMIAAYNEGDTDVNQGFFVTIPSSVPLIGSRLVLNTDNSMEKNLLIQVMYTKLNK